MSDWKHEQQQYPGLRLPDRFGVYLRWPENGDDWIHPEDVELCHQLIPSPRIFQKKIYDRVYNRIEYGATCIRVKPALWLEVRTDGYLIGDRIEIRSRLGKRRPAIATIEETLYNRREKSVDYVLNCNGNRLAGLFRIEDIQPAFRLDEPLNARQRELIEKSRFS